MVELRLGTSCATYFRPKVAILDCLNQTKLNVKIDLELSFPKYTQSKLYLFDHHPLSNKCGKYFLGKSLLERRMHFTMFSKALWSRILLNLCLTPCFRNLFEHGTSLLSRTSEYGISPFQKDFGKHRFLTVKVVHAIFLQEL